MNQVKIKVAVSFQAAMAAGRSAYGETDVTLFDEEIAGLSSVAKSLLVPRSDGSCAVRGPAGNAAPLDVATADSRTVVTALEKMATDRARKMAEKAAEAEEKIRKALAAPSEEWLGTSNDYDDYYIPSPDQPAVRKPTVLSLPACAWGANENDPRIVARREELTREILPLQAEWQAKHDAWKADEARKDEEKKARQEKAAQIAREYVIAKVPDFAPAAKAGKNVSKVAHEETIAEVKSWLGDAGLAAVTSYQDREQDLPRALAYERLERVRATVSDRAGEHPMIRSVSSEIVRCDLCSERSRSTWRTCVLLKIETVVDSDEIAVCAEESCMDNDDGEES